jgi:hypothetical protein
MVVYIRFRPIADVDVDRSVTQIPLTEMIAASERSAARDTAKAEATELRSGCSNLPVVEPESPLPGSLAKVQIASSAVLLLPRSDEGVSLPRLLH